MDPGQNVALDVELEFVFVTIDVVVAARGVLVAVDGISQGLLNAVDKSFEYVVLAVDEQLAPVRSHRAVIPDVRALRFVRLVGGLSRSGPLEDRARVFVVEVAVRVEITGAANFRGAFQHVQAPAPVLRIGPVYQATNLFKPTTGHLGDFLRQVEVLQEAVGDAVRHAQEVAVRENAEPRQRAPGCVELVVRPRFLPRGEESRDAAQRYQRRQAGVLREDLQQSLLRRRGHQSRLRLPGPLEEFPGKHSGVALGEVRERADARVPAGGDGDDVRVVVRLVSPSGGDMQIGRDVADGEPERIEPIAQVRVGEPVADEGERNGGGIAGFFAERRQETLDVHPRKLLAKKVAARLNDCGDLQRRRPGDVGVVTQRTSPMFLAQRTSPSEGSTARFRLFRRSANATAFRSRSASSNPKYPCCRRIS